AQSVGQALRNIQHIDRNQTLLDFCSRTAERSSIERVDRVDRVTNKCTFTPAHHLTADPHRTRQITQRVIVVKESIENLRTGGLRGFLAVVIADVLEQAAFVLQLEVIPILTANKGTAVAVTQLKIMHTLEDLGEGFAFLEVQAAIV